MANPPKPRFDIAEVLARTDLRELLDQYAEPTTTAWGKRWHCPVPDHLDSHASVTTHTDAPGHERWRCWSGDETHRGDAIDLVMVAHRADRAAAIEQLAQRAGMHLGEPLPAPKPRRPSRTKGPVELNPAVADYAESCAQRLWEPDTLRVRQWLAARGFTKDTLIANKVGADPGRRVMPRRGGLPRGDALAATFPALDHNGAVRYVQTRYLQPRPDGPKYQNPTKALGPNPRLTWTVPTGEPRPGVLVVCEGIPDALIAAQAGFRAAGILGSQSADDRVVREIADHADRYSLGIVAVIDADDSGRRSGQRLAELIADTGRDVQIVEPPEDGLDLNDWALTDPVWGDWITASPPTSAEVVMPFDQVTRPTAEVAAP